jgi:4'-phosphopantetheinyl transferase
VGHLVDDIETDQGETSIIAVRLFAVSLAEGNDSADWQILSAAERDRADRFVAATVAARFVRMRATLRRVLSEIEGCPPEALVLLDGPHGKPALYPRGVHFNVSHSHSIGVIAVSAQVPVGVDLERVLPVEGDLIEPLFAQAEQEALAALTGPDRLRALYRCWCRKEAYIKALGVGLSLPLDSFEVSTGITPALLSACDGSAEAWQVLSPDIAEGYEAALAFRADGRAARVILDWEATGSISLSPVPGSAPAGG